MKRRDWPRWRVRPVWYRRRRKRQGPFDELVSIPRWWRVNLTKGGRECECSSVWDGLVVKSKVFAGWKGITDPLSHTWFYRWVDWKGGVRDLPWAKKQSRERARKEENSASLNVTQRSELRVGDLWRNGLTGASKWRNNQALMISKHEVGVRSGVWLLIDSQSAVIAPGLRL